jgi:hypothetical protein
MNQSDKQSTAWPLIFSYRGTILGQGFLADINLSGRVLASPESGGVWVYGVNPGAIAVSAPTLADTNVELRNTLTRLFIDFARETGTFEKFKAVVERFIAESDSVSVAEWQAARAEVRAGRVTGPGDLPKDTSTAEYFVKVTQKPINTVTPQDNLLVQQESTPAVYDLAA